MTKRVSAQGLTLGLRRQVAGGLEGLYESALRGEGSAFEELREYVPGDDVRFIDWNVTARLQSPHVKVFRQERRVRLVFVIDQSMSMCESEKGRTKFRAATQMLAALAATACDHGDEVVVVSTHSSELLRPTRSIGYLDAFLRQLPDPQSGQGRADLGRISERIRPFVTKQTIVVLLSDLGFSTPTQSGMATIRNVLTRFEWVALVPQVSGKSLPAGIWQGRDGETNESGVFKFDPTSRQSPAAYWTQQLQKNNHDVVIYSPAAEPGSILVKWLKARARTPRAWRGTGNRSASSRDGGDYRG